MSRYPQLRSASIPALWAVQRRYGWCSPDGIRQAAAVMGVTPAYLQSVASFYDLFATEPVGTHRVLVCTNISCWMRGGDELLEAFCEAAGADHHEASHHGASSADGEFFVKGFECLGACDLAPMASMDERYYGPLDRRRRARRDRGDARRARAAARQGAAAGGRPPAAPSPTPTRAWKGPTLPERRPRRPASSFATSTSPGSRRSRAIAISAATRRSSVRRASSTRPTCSARSRTPACAGRGGAGFSMGKKGSFLPRGDMGKYVCCNADESEPGAFKDRELMMKNPHQLIEGVAIAALAVGAGHAFIFIRGEYWEIADVLDRGGRRGVRGQLPGRRTCSTPARRSSWSSIAAPAPTSAARRRRCSTRSRASAATRG